jgi:hypothetical protein
MGELLFNKKETKNFAGFYLYCFWEARDHPREKDAEKLVDSITKFMSKKGWMRC